MKRIIAISTLLIVAIISMSGITSQDGKAGKTGAPGETTCATSNCHNDFTLNSGTGSIIISSSNMLNWTYTPGQTYHLSVTVSQSGANPFGFDFEALKVSDDKNAGSLIVTDYAESQLMNATVDGNSRNNITHSMNGGATGTSHSFNFDWTAPSSDVGDITFYAAGNAANGDGTTNGDYIYSTSLLVHVSSAAGTHDLTLPGEFSIYPNPVHDYFTIRFETGTKEVKCNIQLFDLAGALVQSWPDAKVSADNAAGFKIDGNITSGVYFIKMTENGKVFAGKVILSKD